LNFQCIFQLIAQRNSQRIHCRNFFHCKSSDFTRKNVCWTIYLTLCG
jgi:hypothetical protein